MAVKTISFPKGKGHLTHNNRDFISKNVVPERTSWNRIYMQESLEQAYDKCFGQALQDYNAAQKRKDRRKDNYLKEIENSGNKEKTFYENIVQIGKKEDTPVVDENGNLTEEAKLAIEILEQYAKTFQERNPNLYLFNCVMHLDEATPHLHIDYIPVAHGYKTGMETRNSLTKALQQMGFAKAVSKKENETVAWQQRERAYLTDLCREKGIDIEVLGGNPLLGMIIGAVVGVIAEHPTMKLNAFSGFNVDGSYLFPTLFVTIACGAVSGFHSLVSSGTSSKTISNEKDMPMVGYGAMVVESLLGVIALVVVGAVAVNGTKPEGTPFSIFSAGVAGFFEKFGIPVQVATVFMTMCVSALALTSLDSVARIGRMSFQELFYGDTTDTSKMPGWQKVLTNKYFATVVTLFFGYLLTLGGYNNVWPLFGSANQLLAALVLIALSVFLKTTGRTGWTLYVPMFVMLVVTFTALVQKTIALVANISAGQATFLVDGLQLIVAILLMVLGVLVAFSCFRKLSEIHSKQDAAE